MRRYLLSIVLFVQVFVGFTEIAIAEPFAYIPLSGRNTPTSAYGNAVTVVDTASNTVVRTIEVGSMPRGAAVTPDGRHVYVANVMSSNVSVIETASNSVIATVPVGAAPEFAAVTPDGTRVYVPSTNIGSTTVYIISTASNTIIGTVTSGQSPEGIDFTPDGTRAYVANYGSNDVSIIDTTSNTVIATVPVGSRPEGIAMTPDGGRVYVANYYSNTVSVIDTALNSVVDTITVGTHPTGVAVTPDGGRVYVANFNSNSVSVIAAASNNVIETLSVETGPIGVAVTPDGGRVYVANYWSNTLSVIDTATSGVTSIPGVGTGPYGFGKFIGPSGQGVGTLLGKVTDRQAGQSLKDALVNIQNASFNMSDYTDVNGDYRIESIPHGVYMLTASKPGSNYGQYQESFNITGDTTKNISLSPFIYEITISATYIETSQTLEIQATANNLTNGTNVTSGNATYAIYQGGTQLRSGSLTYSAGSARWISGSISFPFTGTFFALVTINGNTGNTNFGTNSNLKLIKANVKDISGNIISGATVNLYSALDQSTPIQTFISTGSEYNYFEPVPSGYYMIDASKGLASGKTETFYTADYIVEKDVTIETNLLSAKYSGQVDQLSNSLRTLINREPALLNGMSRLIDFEINNFNNWDIADKIWSLANFGLDVAINVPDTCNKLSKILMDSGYFFDKVKAIETIYAYIKMLGIIYGGINFGVDLYNDFDKLFNHPDENGIAYGPPDLSLFEALLGKGNHYLPLDYLKSSSTPYLSSVALIDFYKGALKNDLSQAIPDSNLDLDKVTSYLQERNDLLKWSLSNEDYRSQTIFYLPETKNYFMSNLRPIFINYMKDVDTLWTLRFNKFALKGVETASFFLAEPVGFVMAIGLTPIDRYISFMEEEVEGDLLHMWKLSRREYERDLIDFPNYLNWVRRFLQTEFSTPYYLRTGNTFSGQISNVNIEYTQIPILGGIIDIPDTSEINVTSTIINTGKQSRLTLFSENYANTKFATFFKWISQPFLIPTRLLWDRELPQIGVLSDIEYFIYEDAPTNTSYDQTYKLMTKTNFLSQLLDRQKVQMKLYSGPWKVDDYMQTYNLLKQTSLTQPELRQSLLGGVRTLQKVLTLQEAADIVTREKEKHSIALDSGTPIYEQDVTISSGIFKLHVCFYHGEGDADLHLYDGSAHVGFNYDKSANDIEFPATYTGPQSNPEIITIPDAAGKTFHIKINMTQPSGQVNVTGTLIIMEEPLRPAVMATSPLNIEIDAAPGQKGLTISVRVAESSQQSPLNNLNTTISWLTNAYGQSLTLTSSSTYSNSVLSGGAEETIAFKFDVPNNSTKVYTGTITISSDNVGEIIKNVTIRVDSDEDGLPDYWEKIYGFNPEQPGETNIDSDGDGFNNFEEYYWGTDPLDPLDYPSEFASIYVSKDGVCSGKANCYNTVQNGINAVNTPTGVNITRETYNENVILNSPQTILFEGGWNSDFSNNSGQTTINGSLTITDGTLIIENIILQ